MYYELRTVRFITLNKCNATRELVFVFKLVQDKQTESNSFATAPVILSFTPALNKFYNPGKPHEISAPRELKYSFINFNSEHSYSIGKTSTRGHSW